MARTTQSSVLSPQSSPGGSDGASRRATVAGGRGTRDPRRDGKDVPAAGAGAWADLRPPEIRRGRRGDGLAGPGGDRGGIGAGLHAAAAGDVDPGQRPAADAGEPDTDAEPLE